MDFIFLNEEILEYNDIKEFNDIEMVLFYEDIQRNNFFNSSNVLVLSFTDYMHDENIREFVNTLNKVIVTNNKEIEFTTSCPIIFLKNMDNDKLINNIPKYVNN